MVPSEDDTKTLTLETGWCLNNIPDPKMANSNVMVYFTRIGKSINCYTETMVHVNVLNALIDTVVGSPLRFMTSELAPRLKFYVVDNQLNLDVPPGVNLHAPLD